MIPLAWFALGCLGWLVAATGLGVLLGQAIRLADRSESSSRATRAPRCAAG